MRFFLFILTILLLACGHNKNAQVVIHTSLGDIQVQLFDSTPRHSENFILLSENKSGDTLIFYRIERDFAIQFGPLPGDKKHDHTLEQEIQAPLICGALAAATADSSGMSDGANFFIVLGHPQTDAGLDEAERKTSVRFTPAERELYKKHGGLPQLHGKYTVFGQLEHGLETAQKIAALPRDAAGRPLQEVRVWVEIVR